MRKLTRRALPWWGLWAILILQLSVFTVFHTSIHDIQLVVKKSNSEIPRYSMYIIMYVYIHVLTCMLPLKCNIISQECKQIKSSVIKGRGIHFVRECSSRFVWDEYSRLKQVPHPSISKFCNCSHSTIVWLLICAAMLSQISQVHSGTQQHCCSGMNLIYCC